MEYILQLVLQLLVVIGIFAALVFISDFTLKKVKSFSPKTKSKFFNPVEYLPVEELYALKQVFYLIMILVFIIIILYLVFDWTEGIRYVCVLDILISIYLALDKDNNTFREKLLLVFLIPFGSMTKLLFGSSLLLFLDLFHIYALIRFIGIYYRKFVKFTENNSLGITIILLYTIILVSFLFTIIVEGVTPMESITMVTNAFTSNSFEASGKNMIGQLNSLLLAWGGFILSGVGTATLSVSIIMRSINKKFDRLEETVKKNKK